MTFKIDFFSEDNRVISFGPRQLGNVGKDIIAIKLYLGLLLPLNDEGEFSAGFTPEGFRLSVPLDEQSWFQCSSGKGIDSLKAATFDVELKRALSKFQIDNKLLLMSYYFEIFSINEILSQGYDLVQNSEQFELYNLLVEERYQQLYSYFDTEYGTVGEATLAIMHGYTPGRIFENKGYSHSQNVFSSNSENVLSVIPKIMLEDLQSGRLGKIPSVLEEESTILYAKEGLTYEEYQNFEETASSARNWIRVPVESIENEEEIRFKYSFEYGLVAYPVALNYTSDLYKYSMAVLSVPEPTSRINTSSDYRRETARRFFEPDPFTDPPPFIIDEDRIGYFFKTRFLLEPSGPHPVDSEQELSALADNALERVLEFYEKPKIWNILIKQGSIERQNFIESYKSIPPVPNHIGDFPRDSSLRDPERFESDEEAILLKSQLSTLELELSELRNQREPRRGYLYPPASGPWRLDDDASPEEQLEAYLEYVDNLISGKLEAISLKSEEIDNYAKQQKSLDYLVLTTQRFLDEAQRPIAQHWSEIDTSISPLIKFVEYRTPSLRPGQPYRAYFEINRHKLEMIVHGSNSLATVSPQQVISANPRQDAPEELLQACYDQDMEQTLRTYEEHKAHAIRKRREIQREFKQKYEEYVQNQRRAAQTEREVIEDDIGPVATRGRARIDLGYAGPWDGNKAFSSIYGINNVADDREYTRKLISLGVSSVNGVLEAFNVTDTDAENLQDIIDSGTIFGGEETSEKRLLRENDSLEITLVNLKQRIDIAAKDIRRAGSIMKREGIELEPRSNFDGNNEAQQLRKFYTQLVEFIDSQPDFRPILEKYGKNSFEDFSDLPRGEISIKFQFVNTRPKSSETKPLGPRVGKRIVNVSVGHVAIKKVPGILGSTNQKIIYEYTPASGVRVTGDSSIKWSALDAANRPRTVNYIASINYMTIPFSTGTAQDIARSFFDDGLNICQELGIDAEKHVSLSMVGLYTTGIRVLKQDELSAGTVLQDWTKRSFSDPLKRWADTSKQNFKDSLIDTFDEEQALRGLGKLCTLEDLYDEFLDKFDLSSLLCSYLECVRLPGFSLKLPKLLLPPFPKIPILGWLAEFKKFIEDNLKSIITRIVCSFARTIIDKLAFPFCEEQLEDFISAGSSATPIMNQALAQAFTDTGIYGLTSEETGEETKEKAKSLFADVAKIVTGEELCYLLDGKPLDEAGMLMVQSMVNKNGLGADLSDSESIANFFGVIGAYVPIDLCDQLAQFNTPLGTDCADTSDPLLSIRNRLQSGDSSLSEEEVQNVLDIAKQNMEQKKESLNSLSGISLDQMMPNSIKPGSENLLITSMPEQMKNQLKVAMEGIFMPAKMSYLTALNAYVPSLSLPVAPPSVAGDPNYEDLSVLKLECCLERLKNFSAAVEKSRFSNKLVDHRLSNGTTRTILNSEAEEQYREGNLQAVITPAELVHLYAVFETEKVPLDFRTRDGRDYHLVHKHYKPKKETYVVSSNFIGRPGEESDERSYTVQIDSEFKDPNKFNTSDLKELSYQEYKEITYPNPVSDLNDPVYQPEPETTVNQLVSEADARENYGSVTVIEHRYSPEELRLRKETCLKPLSNLEVYKEEEKSRNNSFPMYSDLEIPLEQKEKNIIFTRDDITRTGTDLLNRSDANRNPRSRAFYPRISLNKSVASMSGYEPSKAKIAFALNCSFSILGATNTFDMPEYTKEIEVDLPAGGVQTRTETAFNQEHVAEGVLEWEWDEHSPFFQQGLILSDSEYYLEGNLEQLSVDTLKEKVRPVVSKLLLDISQNGLVELSSTGDLDLEFLNIGVNSSNTANGEWCKFGKVISGMPKVFHEEYIPNNPALLDLMGRRITELTQIIQAEMQNLTPRMVEDYLPLVRAVYKKVASLDVWKYGNLKYSMISKTEDNSPVIWSEGHPLDFLNANFRATPYSPTVKMVEFATKDKTLDAYNLVIDQDHHLRQGLKIGSDRGDNTVPWSHSETPESLNPDPLNTPDKKSRVILKYCDTLPGSALSLNQEEKTFPGGEDFSRRESFSRNMIQILNRDFGTEDFFSIHEPAKTSGFKSVVETIYSHLYENMANSSIYSPTYAAGLNDRLSSKAYVVPGTRCLKNRYSMNETSILSFNKIFLDDASREIEAEMRKPEFSPFNRSFGGPTPFGSAVKRVAFKSFVRACILDSMLKAGTALPVWGMEGIVSEEPYIDYIYSHVLAELEHFKKMKFIWGEIAEDVVPGTNNRFSALNALVREELLKIPSLARQIFNPGLGHIDYHKWHNIGRGGQPNDYEKIDLPAEGKTYFNKSGLFKRLPVPMRSEQISVFGEDFTFWNLEDYNQNNPSTVSARIGRDFQVSKNSTSTVGIESSQIGAEAASNRQISSTVTDFILQDYVRLEGAILNPLRIDNFAETIPPDDIVGAVNIFSADNVHHRNMFQQYTGESLTNFYVHTSEIALGSRPLEKRNWGLYWMSFHIEQMIMHRTAYEIIRTDGLSSIPGNSEAERLEWMTGFENEGNMNEYFSYTCGFLDNKKTVPRGFIGRAHPGVHAVANNDTPKIPPNQDTPWRDLEPSNGPSFKRNPHGVTLQEVQEGTGTLLLAGIHTKQALVLSNFLISLQIVQRLSTAFGIRVEVDLRHGAGQFSPIGNVSWTQNNIRAGANIRSAMEEIRQAIGLHAAVYPGLPYNQDSIDRYPAWANSLGLGQNAEQVDTSLFLNISYQDNTGDVFQIGSELFQTYQYPFLAGAGDLAKNFGDIGTQAGGGWDNAPDRDHYGHRAAKLFIDEMEANEDIDYDFSGLNFGAQRGFISPIIEFGDDFVDEVNQFNSLVVNLEEFDAILNRMSRLFPVPADGTTAEDAWNNVINNSKFFHGVRLNHLCLQQMDFTMRAEAVNASNDDSSASYANDIIRNCLGFYFTPGQGLDMNLDSDRKSRLSQLSMREKNYAVRAKDKNSENYLYGVSIPIKAFETQINIQTCSQQFQLRNRQNYYRPETEDFYTLTRALETSLFETPECKLFMEQIFPIKRYMAVSTISATSSLAGYNSLPKLFESFKSLLGFVTHIGHNPGMLTQPGPTGAPLALTGLMDQAEFQKRMSQDFPSDPDDADCFAFPDLTEDFWADFFNQLGLLMLYFPSILFRGLANRLDPMYKEMRAHYLNCDIDELNWRGTGFYSANRGLTNGLNSNGKPARTRSGEYTNLLALAPDLVDSVANILWDPRKMLRTISKTISYAYSGTLPLIDLSTAFKMPCKDIDRDWLEKGKYDFGKYGRYGHPPSPFTILALSTLQLPADIDKRNSNCQEENLSPASPEVSEQECEDVEE